MEDDDTAARVYGMIVGPVFCIPHARLAQAGAGGSSGTVLFHALRGAPLYGLIKSSRTRGLAIAYHLLALLVRAYTETFQNSKSSELFQVLCF